ncbi:MAG: phosphatase PAP2 family protein [Alphaproteobacteria bacterium]|nr:phosphatase PAP2 family protein [Alphaproteobacteria bacterium]
MSAPGASSRSAAAWPVVVFLGLMAAAAAPFVLAPTVDLEVARFVHRQFGAAFLSTGGAWWPLYVGLVPVVYAIAAIVLLVALANLVLGRRWLGLTRRVAAFILLSLALGPGLVVEVGLKDHWGRARPRDLVEFGGGARFTPAYLPSEECASNCSFTSGHAAMAFYFLTFARLAPAPWRRPAVAAVVLFGGLTGAMRVAQGAHFASDVIASGFLVTGIVWALKAAIVDRGRPGARKI